MSREFALLRAAMAPRLRVSPAAQNPANTFTTAFNDPSTLVAAFAPRRAHLAHIE